MTYRKYPSYKDSGVEWLGEIPSEWSNTTLKYYLDKLIAGGTPKTDVNDNWCENNDGVPWVSIADMTKNTRVSETKKNVSFKGIQEKNLNILPRGTILYSIFASLGKVAIADVALTTNQAILGMVPNKKIEKDFLYWLLIALEKYVKFTASSNTQDNLNSEKVANFPIAIPLQEQQVIANFLDKATDKIDTLIEKQEMLIELLKEKRQAVIFHAVTKGLDLDVKMKDCGVEWLGEVPKHWEIGLLSTLFDNNKTKNTGMKNQNLLSLSYGKIVKKNIDTSFGLLPESFESYQIVKPGYIILRLTDLQNDKKSLRTGLVTQEGIITSAYIGLKKKSKLVGNEKFIHYYLHTFDIYKGFYGMGSGVRQSLNYDELKKLRFVLPPVEEQDEIVKYIDNKTSKIDTLIDKSTKSITLLKEKRTALTSAAVTGKIDVREMSQYA